MALAVRKRSARESAFAILALIGAGAGCLGLGLAALAPGALAARAQTQPVSAYADWPRIASPVKKDPALEAKIAGIVASMTLAQKIGQMTQAEIQFATPADARQYYLGAVLNGGGSWPHKNKGARAAEWAAMADDYRAASLGADQKTPIPILWGTDAVHGHNNVAGATIFPHNIGLGAAHDAGLVKRIAQATARAVRATGLYWAFAPTVAVVQDQRWGRTYEGFSSDPMLVREYARAYVEGLQGDLGAGKGLGAVGVLATAKHFIGDGGTANGVNEGVNESTRSAMINVHGQGYYGAIGAGVQIVMASYNSWNDAADGVNYGKIHGARALLTDALKDKIGFDGFVISDWNAVAQIPGCAKDHCPAAINAGVDLVMAPEDWRAFIANTVKDVESGAIPMARIDDAVTRILRVKFRAGLFDGLPNPLAGQEDALSARALAREAVAKSIVLLKNEKNALPLKANSRVLVVGKSADSLSDQTGGWSLTWQGDKNSNADFGAADSLLAALRASLGAEHVTYSETAANIDPRRYDAVVAVIGETPYAETKGDVTAGQSLRHSDRHPEDLAVLDAVAHKGVPVIAVLYSGRTLYVNDLINRADAFVAAFLPGTEGRGLTDVLVAGPNGKALHDFNGRLSFDWPNAACPGALAPLFKIGYGLRYAHGGHLSALPESAEPKACAGVAASAN